MAAESIFGGVRIVDRDRETVPDGQLIEIFSSATKQLLNEREFKIVVSCVCRTLVKLL